MAGDALRAIENLRHSAYAYEAAKCRLHRKFGGLRRKMTLQLEEIGGLKPIREENALDLERFADLLDVAVINLKESGRREELGNGAFYIRLQKKLPESMIARYQRWLHKITMYGDVLSLLQWLNSEAEFQMVAWDTVHRVSGRRVKAGFDKPRVSQRTYVGTTENKDAVKNTFVCEVCSAPHEVWRCNVFRAQKVWQRWNTAKRLKLFQVLECRSRGTKLYKRKTVWH